MARIPRQSEATGVREVAKLENLKTWDELTLPPEGTRHIYRASALGLCTSALAALAAGVDGADLPATIKRGANEGTAMEPMILERHAAEFGYRAATYPELASLKEAGTIAGYDAVNQQVQVRLPIGGSALLRGHLDRLGTHATVRREVTPKQFYVIEAKAFGPDYWKAWVKSGLDGPGFDRYRWQASALMACTGLTLIMVAGQKLGRDEECEIGEINVRVYEEAPYSVAKVKARVLQAEKFVKLDEVPDCREGLFPCPIHWHPSCIKGEKPGVVAGVVLDDEALGNLCALHVAYGTDERVAKKARDEVKAQIDKLLSDQGHARGTKFVVESSVHERFEFEWVVEPVAESYRPAGERSFPSVKLVK